MTGQQQLSSSTYNVSSNAICETLGRVTRVHGREALRGLATTLPTAAAASGWAPVPRAAAAPAPDGGGQDRALIRKTMRVGSIRTSIKLEGEFWGYLREVAGGRRLRLSGLVNEVAAAAGRGNLASALRTFALSHASRRCRGLERELARLALAGNTRDLPRVLEACPLPGLVLDGERTIRELNRAFALWLNLDPRATLGKRLDTIMILRGPGLKEMWAGLADGRLARGQLAATYVSPGAVRTAQAVAIGLAAPEPGPAAPAPRGGCIILFETLPGGT